MSAAYDTFSVAAELAALEQAIADARAALHDEHEGDLRLASAELRYRAGRIDAVVTTW